MTRRPDPDVAASVRSWYATAATITATAVLLFAAGVHSASLRFAGVLATAAGALAWLEGHRRGRRLLPSRPAVASLAILVVATGLMILFDIATSSRLR